MTGQFLPVTPIPCRTWCAKVRTAARSARPRIRAAAQNRQEVPRIGRRRSSFILLLDGAGGSMPFSLGGHAVAAILPGIALQVQDPGFCSQVLEKIETPLAPAQD